MEFMTTEQVKIEAEKGEIPSLECSLKHHQQGRDAPKLELINAIEDDVYDIDNELCASCSFADAKCRKCCLATGDKNLAYKDCCDGAWFKVSCALVEFEKDYSNANFKAFQEAEGKVCEYIEGVLERKRAEQKGGCGDCKYYEPDKPCYKCRAKNCFEPKESKPALKAGIGDIWDCNGHIYMTGTEFCSKAIRNVCISGDAEILTNIGTGHEPQYPIIGNIKDIFDDLALRAEDLMEFEIESSMPGNKLKAHIDGSDWQYISFNLIGSQSNNTRTFTLAKATEFAHKILQEVAYAKRKQKSK